MTEATSYGLSEQAQDFTWLLKRFAQETAGVIDVIAVSSDGLLIAMAGDADRGSSDRLSAIVSGIVSLAGGAGASYNLGPLNKVIVDAEGGFLIVMAMGAGALLGVVAERSASLGTVAYESSLFINRTNGMLSPQLINELKNSVAG
jgi:predicted regulator of Ras-like GTPase activity (Roadblock/LC7/MglB family)